MISKGLRLENSRHVGLIINASKGGLLPDVYNIIGILGQGLLLN